MHIYRVRLQSTGGAAKYVEVTAQNQAEAHRTAEAMNPGYRAMGSQCLGPARK